jgi:glycosyltransferase involved in cell wall biosynthesis
MTDAQKTVTLSVVICAHNEQEWIARTLDSLLQQKRLPDETIVVDNASTDQTAEITQNFIAAHPGRGIRIVQESKKGLHHAREAGWRSATSEVVVMTDADITFPKDWLRKIEQAFAADSDLAAVTGICRYNDALPIANWVTVMGDQLYQPQGIGLRLGLNKTGEYVLSGGNSAYRRRVLEAVNGYLNKPQGILEDRYMSQKIQQGGYKIRFLRTLKVWHTFRRFKKEGWRGYIHYIFNYTAESVYSDHLSDS